jgi:hypothetical protein
MPLSNLPTYLPPVPLLYRSCDTLDTHGYSQRDTGSGLTDCRIIDCSGTQWLESRGKVLPLHPHRTVWISATVLRYTYIHTTVITPPTLQPLPIRTASAWVLPPWVPLRPRRGRGVPGGGVLHIDLLIIVSK